MLDLIVADRPGPAPWSAESRYHCAMSDAQYALRLRKKHGDGAPKAVSAIDGRQLLGAQSIRDACLAGLIVILIFSLIWISVTELSDRVFPWFPVILGVVLGHSVRLAGRGVDWRFPLLAAVLSIVGSLIGNVSVAASVTAQGLGVGTVTVLRAVTGMTWPVFFNEVLSVADGFYALVAAVLAAFYAKRRLTRLQYGAIRRYREGRQHD